MDEDPFGTSVWATPTTSAPSTSKLSKEDENIYLQSPPRSRIEKEDPFSFNEDDFDPSEPIVAPTSPFKADFDTSGIENNAEEDDFGDFGDFGDPQDTVGFDDYPPEEAVVEDGFQDMTAWRPLRLNPFPDIETLQVDVSRLIQPMWGDWSTFTEEPIRETEGNAKILTSTSRFALVIAFTANNADRVLVVYCIRLC